MALQTSGKHYDAAMERVLQMNIKSSVSGTLRCLDCQVQVASRESMYFSSFLSFFA